MMLPERIMETHKHIEKDTHRDKETKTETQRERD